MEWTLSEVWEWLKQETVRAAGMWLFEFPYAPTVMLKSPPNEDGSFDFATFAVIDGLALPTAPLRGRPVGSGTFATREEFLIQVRLAVQQVESSGSKLTQENVAATLVRKDMAWRSDPVRQLQRWLRSFGFPSWSDFLNSL